MYVECKEFLGGSLFLVGEFGVNDYHFSFQRKSVREVRSYVPRVVRKISMAVEVPTTNHTYMALIDYFCWRHGMTEY